MGFQFNPPQVTAVVKGLCAIANEAFDDVQVRVRTQPALLVEVLFRDATGLGVAGFTLIQQANCCGVIVSTKSWTHEKYRGQGIAQQLMPLKEMIAAALGYSALAATVNVSGNPAEVHILEKCGWQRGFEFTNSRTKNQVAFFFKALTTKQETP